MRLDVKSRLLFLGLLPTWAGKVAGLDQNVLEIHESLDSERKISSLLLGNASLSSGCNVSLELLHLLRELGIQTVDCNTAVHLSNAVYQACSEHGSCDFSGIGDKTQAPASSEDDRRQRASRACRAAELLLDSSSTILQDSISVESYDSAVKVNWSKDCWHRPLCILKPVSTEEVSLIMRIIHRTGARFAVRSGGHNPNQKWASIDSQGVLIDMSRLNQVVIAPDSSEISVGPGNRWVRVYERLEGSGRSVLGGRTPDVGVGGLLLGCGIPNFSSEYGLACDYVLQYEVVLGNGTVVVADQEMNADLWWALKGGGANFGVVTQFVLETVPIDHIWYEARIYAPSENRKLLRAVREYQAAAEEDEKASLAFSLSNNHTIAAFIYSAPVQFPPVFNIFADIPFERHFITPNTGTPYAMVKAFETVLGERPAFKRDIIAVSTKPDLGLYQESYERWLETSTKALQEFDCMMTFGIQPVTSSAIAKSNARGNPLGLSPQSQQWYTSVIQWQGDEFDDLAHEAIKASGGAVRDIAKQKGLLLEFEFINDATWDQNPIASYGASNVRRLREIARRYDPDEVFQRLQGDGHLLRKIMT
ncbi:hypothetical protein GGR51DRAFT_397511 [Nemania sp. FL0031]|nr:hypothetical protein GGR51DRAFT_397511 [Nemania sp. FL0031]